ncbi:MAG TPA: class I SAM-dependent methyltransferase [Chloroflexota bacterium]|nr:class I SAM-dependent methyltransferase [Chloroflexota bacterium]
MRERYDQVAAAHYAAYRPPLHSLILQRVFSEAEFFDVGLDVGCGTGYSAIALAAHSAHVYGVDLSPAMLRQAAPHEKVSYHSGSAEGIPLPEHAVDVVTFAGSLSYTDRAATGAELRRVCRGGAIAVAYDFEIRLEEVLQRFGVEPQAQNSAYDHQANVSEIAGFELLDVGSGRVRLTLTASELAHLLLSDSNRFDRFAEGFGVPDPFPKLRSELDQDNAERRLEADIYYSKHRVIGAG